ncbi:MAG TPA: hypothetical protein VGD43_06255 [Micromonospora sp.]
MLSDVYRLFNVGHDPQFGTPDPRAVVYRERGNRSLSVGDVVALNEVCSGNRIRVPAAWDRGGSA